MAFALSRTPAPTLPTLTFENAEEYVFPFRVKNVAAWSLACRYLDEIRPGHVLSRQNWRCFYIEKLADARRLAEFLPSVQVPVGFDFETRGWNPKKTLRPNIFGGQTETKDMSPAHPESRAVPVIFQVSWGLDAYIVRAEFLYLFAQWWQDPDHKLDYANHGFEFHVGQNVGLTPGRAYRDTIDMDFLYDETSRQNKHGLKPCTEDYLGIKVLKFKDLQGQTFSEDDTEEDEGENDFDVIIQRNRAAAIEYAGLDPLITTLTADYLQHLLMRMPAEGRHGHPSAQRISLWQLYCHTERGFHRSLSHAERAGIPLRKDLAAAKGLELKAKIETLDAQVAQLAKRHVDTASNKDLAKLFFDELGLPVRKTTESFVCLSCGKAVTSRQGYKCKWHGDAYLVNNAGVDDDVLDEMRLDGNEVAVAVTERRTTAKLMSTYLDALYRWATNDGIAHPSIKGSYVNSGRISAGVYLTTPKDYRDIFAFPPGSPHVIVRLDYGQLELRLLAHLSRDRTMSQAFAEGRDLHCFAAGLILLLREHPTQLQNAALREQYYLENLESVARKDENERLARAGRKADQVPLTNRQKECLKLRKRAKGVNFGLAYGMSPSRYAREEGVTLAEANELFDLIWSLYADVQPYYTTQTNIATAAGHLSTLNGRRKRVLELQSTESGERSKGERLVKNVPCQAGAADVVRCAQIACDVDIEAGSPPPPNGKGVYGRWVDGVYQLDYDYLPYGWRYELPPALTYNLGTLGRCRAKMMLQVHDELLFRTEEQFAEEVGARARAIMENPFGGECYFSVPLTTSCGWAKSWKDAD